MRMGRLVEGFSTHPVQCRNPPEGDRRLASDSPMSTIQQELKAAAQRGATTTQERITLNAYLDLVKEQPTLAATAHQRIHNMIMAAGTEPGKQPEETSFNFFADDLFGMDVPLERLVRYFDSAAQGHATRRRIPLLWG